LAGLTGLLSTGLWFASMLLGHAVAGPQTVGAAVTDADALLALHAQSHRQLLSSAAGALHLLLVVPVGLFLVAALRRRRPATGAWLWPPLLCGPPMLGGLALASHFEVQAIATTFVSSGPRTAVHAHHLVAGSTVLGGLRAIDVAARLLLGTWIAAVSLAAIDSGLMTRQLGYFGLGTAIAFITIPAAGDALFIGFLLAISCLALGYWPGGRPAAWDAGAAAPWQEPATDSGR
jgi:hypothetical protein